MKPYFIVILLLATLLTASTGWSDIYRHDDGSDTVSFTDAPHDSRYTLIMRERQPKITKNSKTRIHPTMAKTENPATRSAVLESQQATELPLQGVITSTTGYRNDPFDGRLKHHNGMDIAAPSGTPVKPVASGIVVYSGWRNGYGNSVIIEHDNGMVTVYAHHSSNQVSEGTAVDRSTVIALSGSTGRSTGPHLHFEAWRNGENITPSFLPTGTPQQHQAVAATAVRRYLQPDGTILFTNLR